MALKCVAVFQTVITSVVINALPIVIVLFGKITDTCAVGTCISICSALRPLTGTDAQMNFSRDLCCALRCKV